MILLTLGLVILSCFCLVLFSEIRSLEKKFYSEHDSRSKVVLQEHKARKSQLKYLRGRIYRLERSLHILNGNKAVSLPRMVSKKT